MILKLYTAAALLTVVAFVSCAGNKDKDYVDKSIIPPGSETTAVQQPVAPATTTPNTTVLPANTVPGNTTAVPATNMVSLNPQPQPIKIDQKSTLVNSVPPATTAATTATTTTAPGMNPPHGQPGHRCDISVGAPLNSKPAPTTPQPVAVNTTPQQPQVVTTTPVPTQTKTAPGMNPPHGEPNHRCDIAVGAPLNSKPVTPAVTTTPAPLVTPSKPDSNKN